MTCRSIPMEWGNCLPTLVSRLFPYVRSNDVRLWPFPRSIAGRPVVPCHCFAGLQLCKSAVCFVILCGTAVVVRVGITPVSREADGRWATRDAPYGTHSRRCVQPQRLNKGNHGGQVPAVRGGCCRCCGLGSVRVHDQQRPWFFIA